MSHQSTQTTVPSDVSTSDGSVNSDSELLTEYPAKHINLTTLCRDLTNLSNCQTSGTNLDGMSAQYSPICMSLDNSKSFRLIVRTSSSGGLYLSSNCLRFGYHNHSDRHHYIMQKVFKSVNIWVNKLNIFKNFSEKERRREQTKKVMSVRIPKTVTNPRRFKMTWI